MLDNAVMQLNDALNGMYVEMEGMDQQISDMWSQYDTLSMSLSTIANQSKIDKVNTQMGDIQRIIDDMYVVRDNKWAEISTYEGQRNTMEQEAHLTDLKDEMDYVVYYRNRVTQEIANQERQLAAAEALAAADETNNGDDAAVIQAVIDWMTVRRDEMATEAEHATAIYNEEFAYRQKQKEEEKFYKEMEDAQNNVNKMWDEYNA